MSANIPAQVHYLENHKIVVGEHPDADVRDIVQDFKDTEKTRQNALDDFLENAPNLNDKYKDIINTVQKQLAADGLPCAPITILDEENYELAGKVGGDNGTDETAGIYYKNHILLPEQPDKIEAFGDQYPKYLMGAAFHEGAHSSMGEKKHAVVSHIDHIKDALGSETLHRTINTRDDIGGFKKYQKTPENEFHITGDFWEEGFADLYRVQKMEEMGIDWDIPGKGATKEMPDDEKVAVRYTGSDKPAPYLEKETGIPALPFKFAGGARMISETQGNIIPSVSGIAAYGINLLDQRAPGLFDDMVKSRTDPNGYRSFVQKVESIKPGLYRELRAMPQTSRDFSEGLKTILETLELDDKDLSF